MGLAIVTCMDARIDPVRLFGLKAGGAHALRNAGGVVTDDVIRSLVLSQRLLGTIDVLLLHPTGCGLQGLGRGRHEGRDRSGDRDTAAVSPSRPSMTSTPTRGFVYDVDNGTVREVV
jgi:carbonic anhydrase